MAMSIAEMKLEIISKIVKLNDEKALQDLLQFLDKISATDKQYNLSQHFDTIADKYGTVLEKLA